jgi:23S rRNA (adenine2503-C2)-methyltransferase
MNKSIRYNLLDFDRATLRALFAEMGEKTFRADQLIQWIHQYGIQTFDAMTNLSKSLRHYLKDHMMIRPPHIVMERQSIDGTRKWLLELDDGNTIETVYIPERGRGTLCISSQVGCPLGCVFCATGKQGFKRNLKASEIIGQVWLVVRALSKENGMHDRQVTNVVFMGMGEPLLNFDPVFKAINLIMDDFAYNLSKYRVTVSTSGIVPMINRLAQCSTVSLAVSLHASNDRLRDQLMPINRKYPLKALMAACKHYFNHEKRRKIAFEYIMLKDINDQLVHAKELLALVRDVPCKFNLIPYNETMGGAFQSSDQATIDRFRSLLIKGGIQTVTRKRRGVDIEAACGQLRGLKREGDQIC